MNKYIFHRSRPGDPGEDESVENKGDCEVTGPMGGDNEEAGNGDDHQCGQRSTSTLLRGLAPASELSCARHTSSAGTGARPNGSWSESSRRWPPGGTGSGWTTLT